MVSVMPCTAKKHEAARPEVGAAAAAVERGGIVACGSSHHQL
jgi:hypothetical protein